MGQVKSSWALHWRGRPLGVCDVLLRMQAQRRPPSWAGTSPLECPGVRPSRRALAGGRGLGGRTLPVRRGRAVFYAPGAPGLRQFDQSRGIPEKFHPPVKLGAAVIYLEGVVP